MALPRGRDILSLLSKTTLYLFNALIELIMKETNRKKIWAISASDSCSGAGLQADLKMAHALNVECGTLVSALTAQSSFGVDAVETISFEFLESQWQSLKKDGWPQVIKIGWFPKNKIFITWLIEKLSAYKTECPQGWVVWDPVLSASQGGLEAGELAQLKPLFLFVDVITPNEQEALQLTGCATAQEAGEALQQAGIAYVVISGGDSNTDKSVVESICFAGPNIRRVESQSEPEQSVLTNFMIQQPRITKKVHGSGCHFASAIAAYLANGERLYDALLLASATMSQIIQQASETPSGYCNAWATAVDRNGLGNLPAAQWPVIVPLSDATEFTFPRVEQALGLYGLVDNLDWLDSLLELGVDTLQWRVKSPALYEQQYGEGSYQRDMQTAIERCKQQNIPLYINDDWPMAVELGAYGVHLGQEDMLEANLSAISEAGLALGVSTHTEWEIARARAFKPSYIAFGPVHPPLSKKLKYPPLGYTNLSNWCARIGQEFPVTCIGGITTENIANIKHCGMPSAAIVTDLMIDNKLPQRHLKLRGVYP